MQYCLPLCYLSVDFDRTSWQSLDFIKDLSFFPLLVCTFEVMLKGSFSATRLKNILSFKKYRFSFLYLRHDLSRYLEKCTGVLNDSLLGLCLLVS